MDVFFSQGTAIRDGIQQRLLRQESEDAEEDDESEEISDEDGVAEGDENYHDQEVFLNEKGNKENGIVMKWEFWFSIQEFPDAEDQV